MNVSDSLKGYIVLFLQEASEQIERLSAGILKLEIMGASKELVDELFRDTHSLKGAAATLGFTTMAEIAHMLEDILDLLRSSRLSASATLVDVLLAAIDELRASLIAISDTGTELMFSDDLKVDLRRILSGNSQQLVFAHDDKSAREFGNEYLAGQTVRISAERLDALHKMVGEMLITGTRLDAIGKNLRIRFSSSAEVNQLVETTSQFERLLRELRDDVMTMRMLPLNTVFIQFPRLVRDLAHKSNKEIKLFISGADIELDKTIVEALIDPLISILRNSVDHGIEQKIERRAVGKPSQGNISLSAFQEGNHVIVEVSDDGRGIDWNEIISKAVQFGYISSPDAINENEKANLIFLPGVTTAVCLTDVSGRGVGLDLVKKSLLKIGGMIEVRSSAGKGTTFSLRLPLTIAIKHVLQVEANTQKFAIPLSYVVETLRIPVEHFHPSRERLFLDLRGEQIKVINLRSYLELQASSQQYEFASVVVVGFAEHKIGLIVDRVFGEQEMVIKPLGEILGDVPEISGATIGSDGMVILILNVGTMMHEIFAGNLL